MGVDQTDIQWEPAAEVLGIVALNRVDLGDSIAGKKNLDMTMDRHLASSLSTYHHHQGDL